MTFLWFSNWNVSNFSTTALCNDRPKFLYLHWWSSLKWKGLCLLVVSCFPQGSSHFGVNRRPFLRLAHLDLCSSFLFLVFYLHDSHIPLQLDHLDLLFVLLQVQCPLDCLHLPKEKYTLWSMGISMLTKYGKNLCRCGHWRNYQILNKLYFLNFFTHSL